MHVAHWIKRIKKSEILLDGQTIVNFVTQYELYCVGLKTDIVELDVKNDKTFIVHFTGFYTVHNAKSM